METQRARQDALSFLKSHKVGTLATLAPERDRPQARTVYYTADDDFNVYILTLTNTRKYAAVDAHPQAAFVVTSPDVPQTLQMEGLAADITSDEEAAQKKGPLFDALNSNPWFYGPVTKLDPADTAIIWLRPTWVRWADYAFAEQGTAHVFVEITV